MKRGLLLAAALFLAGCNTAATPPARPTNSSITSTTAAATTIEAPQSFDARRPVSALVTKVVDGDSLYVLVNGKDEEVRIVGADTPETKDFRKPVQCYGPEASDFAHKTLDGQFVSLVSDPTQADVDKYQRKLRYVRLKDGTDYSLLLVQQGYARVYVYDRRPQEYDALMKAQTEAQAARRGLWAACPS